MNLDLGNGVELVTLTTSNATNNFKLIGNAETLIGNESLGTLNTGGTVNVVNGFYNHLGYVSYPWYTVNYNTEPVFDIKTRKVENGFVVLKGTKEYVFSDEKELAKFIKDSYKTKKEK